MVSKYTIPVPPLPIQREIVHILDKFTELTAELTAELSAELTARKKQYDYYRNIVMTFGDPVKWLPLDDVIVTLKTGLNPRKNFILNPEGATNYYVTVREIVNGNVVFLEKTDMVSDEAIRLINNRSNLEEGDVLFSGTGTIGRIAVVKETPMNWNIKEGVYVIKPNYKRICSKYLAHILSADYIVDSYKKKIVGTCCQFAYGRFTEIINSCSLT